MLAITLAGCDSMSTGEAKLPDQSSIVPNASQLQKGTSLSASAQTANDKLKRVSRAVAKVLADDNIRQYVYRSVMEKRTGEPTTLWMDLNSGAGAMRPAAMEELGALAWSKLLARQTQEILGQQLGSVKRLDAAIRKAGRLLGGPIHLGWINAESSNPQVAPWVTFTPIGIDADKITQITAFDAEGDSHLVNEQIANDRPVVVISNDERTTFSGELISGSAQRTSGIANAELPPCPPDEPNCYDSGGGGSDDGDETEGGSDSNDMYLRLDWVEFYDDYEGYLKHSPEFKFQVTRYHADSDQTEMHHYHDLTGQVNDSDIGNRVHLDAYLFPWQKDQFPSQYFKYYEYDGDDDVPLNLDGTFKTPLGNLSFEEFQITVHQDDYPLGEAMIHKSEANPSAVYSTGAPNFQITYAEGL